MQHCAPPKAERRLSEPVGYWPWVWKTLHLEGDSNTLYHGVVQQEDYFDSDRPYWIEYMLLQGFLEDARITIDDMACARRLITNAPAILYQVPQIPELKREGELLQLVWPEDEPISHRFAEPPALLRGCCFSITWNRIHAQPKPLQVVFLCRPWTDAEIARAQGR